MENMQQQYPALFGIPFISFNVKLRGLTLELHLIQVCKWVSVHEIIYDYTSSEIFSSSVEKFAEEFYKQSQKYNVTKTMFLAW